MRFSNVLKGAVFAYGLMSNPTYSAQAGAMTLCQSDSSSKSNEVALNNMCFANSSADREWLSQRDLQNGDISYVDDTEPKESIINRIRTQLATFFDRKTADEVTSNQEDSLDIYLPNLKNHPISAEVDDVWSDAETDVVFANMDAVSVAFSSAKEKKHDDGYITRLVTESLYVKKESQVIANKVIANLYLIKDGEIIADCNLNQKAYAAAKGSLMAYTYEGDSINDAFKSIGNINPEQKQIGY